MHEENVIKPGKHVIFILEDEGEKKLALGRIGYIFHGKMQCDYFIKGDTQSRSTYIYKEAVLAVGSTFLGTNTVKGFSGRYNILKPENPMIKDLIGIIDVEPG